MGIDFFHMKPFAAMLLGTTEDTRDTTRKLQGYTAERLENAATAGCIVSEDN